MTQTKPDFRSYFKSKIETDGALILGAGSAALTTLLFVIALHEQWDLMPRATGMCIGLMAALALMTFVVREVMRRSNRITNDERPRSTLGLFAGMFAAALLSSSLLVHAPIRSGFAYREGKQLLEAGNYAAATAAFNRYIDIHPKVAAGYFWRGKTAFKAGEMEDAYADFKIAIKLQPRDWNSHILLLGTLQKLGRDDELKQQLNDTTRLRSDLGADWQTLLTEIAS